MERWHFLGAAIRIKPIVMLTTHFKATTRSLWKNKTYSFLNIFGLAIGMACAGLIFLWVEDEMTFDNFHEKQDRLYITKVNSDMDNGVSTHTSTPGVMGPALKAELPGIANTCRYTEEGASLLFTVGDKPLYATGRYAEASLFDMFTLPFVQGNPKTAFTQLYSLVITEKTARKFFGTEKNALGKTVRVNREQDYVVTGVLKDLPANSTLRFEWIAPFEIYYRKSPWAQRWDNSCLTTFVELKPGVTAASVDKLLYNYIKQKVPGANTHPFLFNMHNWRLYGEFRNGKPTGGGRITYVRLFATIAWIILFIACINFMNLATARSEKRAREVGVRKVLGVGKSGLVLQFMSEALAMAFISAVAAVLIMALFLPAFNTLVQKELVLGLRQPLHIAALLGIALVSGIVAGSYPSFYLSSFNPVAVLKGLQAKTGSAAFIRKGLVIIQFTMSIMLIIGTIIIYQQIQHVKHRNLGFNKDNLIQMNLQGDMLKNFPLIKQDLLNTGVVTNVSVADHETIYGGNNTTGLDWPGKSPGSQILVSQRVVSPEYVNVAGMQLVDGRDFKPTDVVEMTPDFEPKDSTIKYFNILVTESMAKLLGEGSAIGKTMLMPGDKPNQNFNLRVIGVVKDYVYGNMYGKPDPVVFFCLPQFTTLMYVRIKQHSDTEAALDKIAGVMKKDNPDYPFEYGFVDGQFNDMFMSEMLISKLSRVFAVLAILISCLGLFGLAAYTAERRTKEIGVRKVLGASTFNITRLLSRGFLRLVIVSAVIAFPLTWWIMNSWLQQYSYRISIQWWVFIMAGVLAMIIALGTISFQSVKAALANPIKSLRSE